jgi:putative transposase
VSQVIGFIKGKSATYIAGVCEISLAKASGLAGFSSPPWGVTIRIREYIKNQEAEDNRLEQLNLWR